MMLNRLSLGQVATDALDYPIYTGPIQQSAFCGSQTYQDGSLTWLGRLFNCVQPLTTASGTTPGPPTPVAPAPNTAAMQNFNPDILAAQQYQSSQTAAAISAAAAAANAAAGTTPAGIVPQNTGTSVFCSAVPALCSTSTWVMVGIIATLGLVIYARK